jgi:exosortase
MLLKINMPKFIYILLAVAAIASIHYSSLYRIIIVEWQKAAFHYCYVMPVVIGILVWMRRHELIVLSSRPSWIGLLPILTGCAFLLRGEPGDEFLYLYISFWFMILGCCWSLLGWQKLKIILFPIALILTMLPLPRFIYVYLTTTVQAISTKIAAQLLKLFQIPVLSQGNVLDLPEGRFAVTQSYFDLRFLIPLIISSLIIIYVFRDKPWKGIIAVALSLPLGIFFNGVRMAALAFWFNADSSRAVAGWMHESLGWLLFLLGIGVLIAVMYVLPGRQIPGRTGPQLTWEPEDFEQDENDVNKREGLPIPYFAAIAVLLGMFFYLNLA